MFANLFMGTVGAAGMKGKVLMRLVVDLPLDIERTFNPIGHRRPARKEPLPDAEDAVEEPPADVPFDEDDLPDDGVRPPEGPDGGPVAET